MCVGDPVQIVAIDGIAGRTAEGGLVDLSLTPDVAPGQWVLAFLGAAREILPETEALRIRAALEGLRAVMAGGDPGDAFADLEARTPRLPPHLQAALDAGRSQG
ncbi:HypC/HybG/HupF family hydrogenase formation chaperone [Phaeovulum vinaykumarii]|uniref:Hydrogenase expression/formation protein HypC n=1 Tax=Phaeovulum vinaykumarii TaxID=407234 RepID=A0A1N7L9X2_9RHOB|nr:HypC/HybG/HupF family hydrogenase formation chaperone [Phaeovulum vinaykumarii]SIS70652.1 hydrogenase expression/formation protein HypC [Phaeovulum vinaykumarii]SOB98786.1 hydrogenase expression/formation protein HypC [Phaeovulum vinaykumarii]